MRLNKLRIKIAELLFSLARKVYPDILIENITTESAGLNVGVEVDDHIIKGYARH
jgi:hypothetical protein